ncbi:hypothetical protein Mapa_009087 [Marchantia paleacea]|nr:hypothetical protein Mapa_009087 [Marchantia paleacea]
MGFGLLQVAVARVTNLLGGFALVSHRKKTSAVSRIVDDYQATQLTKLQSLGMCSAGSDGSVMEDSDNPERCLLLHTHLHHASQQQKIVHRDRTEFSKCLGGTFCFKATKASVIAQRKDPYKSLHGGRGDETSRCRRRGLRRRLTTCIRIDKDLELSGVRVRQVLYYA